MAGPRFALLAHEVDPIGLAVKSALVAGALSLLDPFLVSLVGTLAALTVASWMIVQGSRRPSACRLMTGGAGLGLAFLSIGAGLFLFPLPGFGAFRGAILAASLLPLWWAERAGTRRRTDPEGPK